jgi:translation initiation factor IF-2
MESSGPGPAEPEVPLADAAIATQIAQAAATGRGADRAPTLEQLLAAFGEREPTLAARRRVRAALAVAGLGVRPDLLNAEPGQRLMLLPPGAGAGPSRGRAVAGLAALAVVLGLAIGGASLFGKGSTNDRASDSLPAETSTFALPATATATASTATPASATTPADTTPAATTPAATTPATATTTTTPAAPSAAEIQALRHKRAARIRAQRRKQAARRTVTVRVDASARPTFLCVDDGQGRQLFGGTLTGRKTFTGRRVRLNVGLASTRVTVNGNAVTLNGSPAGLDITRTGGARELPSGNRPCG